MTNPLAVISDSLREPARRATVEQIDGQQMRVAGQWYALIPGIAAGDAVELRDGAVRRIDTRSLPTYSV